MIYLTRRYRFSAAHRLHTDALTPEENARVYGKCNNPLGHGHNYVLEVTVGGTVDAATGMVCDLGYLDGLVRGEILDLLDESHLNLDVANFRERVPTSENICLEVFRLLEPKLRDAGPGGSVSLRGVRLEETSSNSIEYYGGANGLEIGQKVS